MRYIELILLGAVAAFAVICFLHRENRHSNPDEVVVTVDTLHYSDVEPVAISPPSESDSLPVYHFMDTLDGRWSADVAGRDVELRSLVLRERIESRRSVEIAPPAWEVSAQGGFNGDSRWVGVGVERNIWRLRLSLGAGYDPFNHSPHVEGSVGVVLWRAD